MAENAPDFQAVRRRIESGWRQASDALDEDAAASYPSDGALLAEAFKGDALDRSKEELLSLLQQAKTAFGNGDEQTCRRALEEIDQRLHGSEFHHHRGPGPARSSEPLPSPAPLEQHAPREEPPRKPILFLGAVLLVFGLMTLLFLGSRTAAQSSTSAAGAISAFIAILAMSRRTGHAPASGPPDYATLRERIDAAYREASDARNARARHSYPSDAALLSESHELGELLQAHDELRQRVAVAEALQAKGLDEDCRSEIERIEQELRTGALRESRPSAPATSPEPEFRVVHDWRHTLLMAALLSLFCLTLYLFREMKSPGLLRLSGVASLALFVGILHVARRPNR